MRTGRLAAIGVLLTGIVATGAVIIPNSSAGAFPLTPSSTTITAVPPAPVSDQPISVTVNVTGTDGGTPTGTVTVSDGSSNTSAPCLLDGSGTATCNITESSAGPVTLTASYGGDGTYDPSSATTTVTVLVRDVLQSGSVSGGNIGVGDVLMQAVTLNGFGTSCAGTAEETVLTNPTASGTATLDLTSMNLGDCTGTSSGVVLDRPSTMSITSGAGNPVATGPLTFDVSTSGGSLVFRTNGLAGSWTNATNSSTVTGQLSGLSGVGEWTFGPFVDTSANGSPDVFLVPGSTVSFTSNPPRFATVGGATYTPTATGVATSPVVISADTSSTGCTLTGGVVQFITTGTCLLDANQAGDSTYAPAVQVQQSILILSTVASTVTTITSTSPNPQVGQPIGVTVNVSGADGGTPTGAVTVSDGSTNTSAPCSLDGSGNATCYITEHAGGPVTLTASYGGDGLYDASTATASVTVGFVASMTSIIVGVVNPPVGKPIGVMVIVSGADLGRPTGTVTVSDGSSNNSAPCPLDGSGGATCSITEHTAGPVVLTATYGGDGTYGTSSATTTVNVVAVPSTTTITSTTINPAVGQAIHVGVNVTGGDGGVPSGSVAVSDGSLSVPCALDASGNANCSITRSSAGTETLTVTYVGDGYYQASSATTTINPAGCVGISTGTYIGSFGTVSNPTTGYYGSATYRVTVHGSTFDSVVTEAAGRTVVAAGTTFKGTFNCTSVWGSGTYVPYLYSAIQPDGSLGGTFTDSSNNVDWLSIAPEISTVSDASGSAVTTGTTVSASDPVQASVSSPGQGQLSVSTADNPNGGTVPGNSLIGPVAQITTPAATDAAPLTLTMTVSLASLHGTAPSAVTVFENGSPAAKWCATGAPPIDPATDPCEVNPPSVDPTTSTVTFTVLSTHASVWTLGATCKFSLSPFFPRGKLHLRYAGSLAACGGKQPWRFSKLTGTLPPGLTLSSKGAILGTPTKIGTYSFTIKLADSSVPVKTVTKTVSITIS